METKPPPPFTLLRTIEAAARHRNYSSAAKELSVTHSAVSQAIKRLETQIGTKLFERRGVAMEPSDAALQLAQAYSQAASAIEESLNEILVAKPPSRIRIAMARDFARFWFAPRLVKLESVFPEIALDLATNQILLEEETCDIAVGLGLRQRRGWKTVSLFEVKALPVCTPGLAEERNLRTFRDIANVPLLSDRALRWGDWAASAGLPTSTTNRAFIFDDPALVIDAALRSQGLALSYRPMIDEYLAAGTLIAPFGHEAPTGIEMVAAWSRGGDNSALAQRIVDWMRTELNEHLDVQGHCHPA